MDASAMYFLQVPSCNSSCKKNYSYCCNCSCSCNTCYFYCY